MKNKPSLSIAIASFNDGQFIKSCLDSVADIADEIVVYNAESSDNTVQILKEYSKVKVITGPNHQLFHINKQIAIDACHGDWVLQLDADEVVSPELKKEISETIADTKSDGFWIKRRNYFLGRFLTKGGVYPDATIRLYRRGLGKLPCKDVHEQAEVKGSVSTLNYDLFHFADQTFSRYLLRNDRYTSLLAKDYQKAGVKISFGGFLNYFIIKPISWFFLAYFRHRAYVDGFPGFVFAWYSSLRFPIAYIKLFELKHEKI